MSAMTEASMDDMERAVSRYFELWERQDANGIEEIFAPDASYVVKPFGQETYTGLEAIRQYWRDNPIAGMTDPKPRVITSAYGKNVAFVEWETTYIKAGGINKVMRGIMLLMFEGPYIKELREHFETRPV